MTKQRDKRFILYEDLKKEHGVSLGISDTAEKMGSWDTYEEACNMAERPDKQRIPYFTVIDSVI